MELPRGWAKTTLDSISHGVNGIVDGPFGSNLKTSDYISDIDHGVPVLTTKNLEGDYSPSSVRYISKEKFESLKRSQVIGGDIIVAKIGSIGKTGIYPIARPTAMIPANLLKFTVAQGNDKSYVHYYLKCGEFQKNIKGISSATAQPAFNVTKFRSLTIPLPPLAEQHRIVAKIDALFSKLDKGVETLQTIRQQLRTYRQAVLKWAFEGKLTSSEWKMSVLGKVAVDLKIGPFGTLLHKEDYISGGVPVINPKHMKEYKIYNDDSVSISMGKAADLQSYTIYENDVLIARRGEMGRTAYVSERENGWLCGTGSMIIRFSKEYNGQLFAYLLSAEQSRKYLVDNCSGTTMSNLNEKIIKGLPMPQIPIEDQTMLLAAIESRLSVCDKIESIVDENLAKADALRQSILKKAFAGQLVPQDPSDEPAAVLLERIRKIKVIK